MSGRRPPEVVDRMLVGACGAIWLVLLAMSVIATVALVRLAGGHAGGGERQSSWLLYTIIVVSALIIAGAIPLLLRARRGNEHDSATLDDDSAAPASRRTVRPPDAQTEKMRVFGVDPYRERRYDVSRPVVAAIPAAVLDRLWLRGTVSLLGVMGLALTAVAAATYLLASASETGAWIALGVAGVITIAMPAVLAFYQRRIADAEDEAAA